MYILRREKSNPGPDPKPCEEGELEPRTPLCGEAHRGTVVELPPPQKKRTQPYTSVRPSCLLPPHLVELQ